MTDTARRATAISILALGALVALVAVGWPLMRALELRSALGQGHSRLASAQQAVREGADIGAVTTASLLLTGGSTSRAAADLQLRIGAVARANNARVRSVQVLAARRTGELSEVAVDVVLAADSEALRGLVHQLETSLPLLIVDEASIRTAGPGAPGAETMQLEIGLKLRGFTEAKEAP